LTTCQPLARATDVRDRVKLDRVGRGDASIDVRGTPNTDPKFTPFGLNARVASLVRYEKTQPASGTAGCLSESRAPCATRPDSCPLPVTDHSVPQCGRRSLPTILLPPISRLCSSVANLDAGSIPNAPIAIPNRSASGPVACRPYVDGSGRYVHRGWLIVAGAARYRSNHDCRTKNQHAHWR
jgi:hypothetical protein